MTRRWTAALAAGLMACAAQDTPATRERVGVGTPADSATLARWDFDIDTLGHGLPAGRGTVAEGAAIWAAKCASCHGANGEGVPPAYPRIVGREPRAGFGFAKDPTLVRTVGNYWPYATSLYDYIQRAMPYTAPGSLTANETYAVTAWVLSANDILPADATLDADALRRVRMPAAGRFVDDNRPK